MERVLVEYNIEHRNRVQEMRTIKSDAALIVKRKKNPEPQVSH